MIFGICELFDAFDMETLETLEKISSLRKFSKGQIIYYEQDKINYLNYLKEGVVKIYKVDRFDNEIFLYNIYKNDFITELMSFESINCFSNAQAVEDCEVIFIDFERFKKCFEKRADVISAFYDHFLRRIKMLQCIINREIVFDGSAKVAHMLYNDSETFNRLKKQEIAKMLNIQPETLSRILKKLTREGAITQESGTLEVLDSDMLKRVFE